MQESVRVGRIRPLKAENIPHNSGGIETVSGINVKVMFEWTLGAVVVAALIGTIVNSLIGVDVGSWPDPLPAIWPIAAIVAVIGVVYMFARSAGLLTVAWPLILAAFAPAILAQPVWGSIAAALALTARFVYRLVKSRRPSEVRIARSSAPA
jgi:hypothetical protein